MKTLFHFAKQNTQCKSDHFTYFIVQMQFLPVSGSLKSGNVIVLSCRLSAIALSNKLLPRPESLQ